jgi:hypothetical protein
MMQWLEPRDQATAAVAGVTEHDLRLAAINLRPGQPGDPDLDPMSHAGFVD